MTWFAENRCEQEDWAALRWAAHVRLLRQDMAQPTEQQLCELMNMAGV
jgi:hypothetical protein